MTPKEFVALWGGSDLVHPPEGTLTSLTSTNAAFLREAGLPRKGGLQLDFSAVGEGLPSLRDALAAKQLPIMSTWAPYKILGQDNASYLCLEPGRDEVAAVWPRERLQRFVNATLPQFAECLLGYREMSKGSDHLDDEGYAEELRRYIRRVDARALEDDE